MKKVIRITSLFIIFTFILTTSVYPLPSQSQKTLRPKMLFDGQNGEIGKLDPDIIDYSNKMCVTDLPDDAINGEVVLLSADLNVGEITGRLMPEVLMRIRAIKEDLMYLLRKRAKKTIIISHNGAKKDYRKGLEDGEVDPGYSLKRITDVLTGLLSSEPLFRGKEVLFAKDCIGKETEALIKEAAPGSVILLEQTRFYAAETSEDPNEVDTFAKKIQDTVHATVFVNAGAGKLHRDNVSNGPVADFIKGPKVLGILPKEELKAMHKIANNPKRKVVGIFGGAKLEGGKMEAIKKLIKTKAVDRVLIVGKMAIPFIKHEKIAEKIMNEAKKNHIELILPEKVIAAEIQEGTTEKEFVKRLKKEKTPKHATLKRCGINNVPKGWSMLDIQAKDIKKKLRKALSAAMTVIYNGTAGVNENEDFVEGTNAIINTLKEFKKKNPEATLVALGGDGVKAVLSHLGQEGAEKVFNVLSTMGGAALDYLSGKELLAMKYIDSQPEVRTWKERLKRITPFLYKRL